MPRYGTLFSRAYCAVIPVVALITEWRDENGNVEVRSEQSDLGGTMRLGSQGCFNRLQQHVVNFITMAMALNDCVRTVQLANLAARVNYRMA
jgi:hypothetical protein